MNNHSLPLCIETIRIYQQNMEIDVPIVSGLTNLAVQHKMNQTIINVINTLIAKQYEEQQTTDFAEMIGTYEVKTNERNILSLSISNYAIFPYAAHGLTYMKSLTFDTNTGKIYQLANLFKPGSNYVEILSNIVKEQIEARNLPTLEPFTAVRPDQDFYIADKVLVLYFQLYELTAYVYGFPMFPISVYELEDINTEEGPLGRMATNA